MYTHVKVCTLEFECMKRFVVYCLVLQNDHFYIGSTSDLQNRLNDHCDHPNWFVYKYDPIIDVQKLGSCNSKDEALRLERSYAEIFRSQYGRKSVMGGGFLPFINNGEEGYVRAHLEDRCFYCGRGGHYANECPRRCENQFNFYRDNGDDYGQCEKTWFPNPDTLGVIIIFIMFFLVLFYILYNLIHV
jgi:predicted GIY-YIG superfamily endonuclease